MKWLEVRAVWASPGSPQALELVCNAFHEAGLKELVVEDPDERPSEDWYRDAPPPPSRPAVMGYFPVNDRLPERCRKVEAGLARLEACADLHCQVAYRQLDEQDWAESWKRFFWPEKVGRHLVVKPTWRSYAPGPDEIVLEIDPGMAFGTGTHPTTAMCLALIEDCLKPGDGFLDVGTGSGILMVAAARLGAARVAGIDSDEVAVAVARQNLALNGIGPDRGSVAVGRLVAGQHERFEVVAANILAPVILTLLPDVGRVLAPGGTLICSGIIDESRSRIERALTDLGYGPLRMETCQEWVAVAARAPQAG